MKKIKSVLVIGLICSSLIQSFALSGELSNQKKKNFDLIEENSLKDEKIISLDNELSTYKNEFLDFNIEQKFRIAANIYQIDFNILYAISKLETGNFTSDLFLSKNNPGGIKTLDGKDYQSFSSDFEGIVEMARLLKKYYFDEGLTTIEAIGEKYCPNPEDKWVEKVKKFME